MIFPGIPGFFSLKRKSDVFLAFSNFKTQMENMLSTTIKSIRIDGGGEFINNKFAELLSTNGIFHQVSCPYTPSQNGVAERKHRHIIETTVALFQTASMPTEYWGEAVLISVYLISRLRTTIIRGATPYFKLYNKEPDYNFLRVFGCECFPCLKPYAHSKLSPRSTQCIFIGYAVNAKAIDALM